MDQEKNFNQVHEDSVPVPWPHGVEYISALSPAAGSLTNDPLTGRSGECQPPKLHRTSYGQPRANDLRVASGG
jgi:hypothetical protein